MSNTMQSEVLKGIQGEQPRSYELAGQIAELLAQYGLDNNALEKTRIPSILAQTEALAQETGDQLAVLRAETMVQVWLSKYARNVDLLKQWQAMHVANIMNAANDDSRLAA